MFGSAWLCILRFFFQNLGGRGVFLEGVQKYFEKVEMMWSNFQKARDARARTPPSVLGGKYKKNTKKVPKIEKIAFFGPKNHPLKVSSATWTGVFRQPPVECLRSENLLTLIFVLKRGRIAGYFFVSFRCSIIFLLAFADCFLLC